ncbi:hypothetical protein [Shewanella psychrotolerans]|uniref:hypothetical protein n=1 Tax=Shewanella psychrotolerans TaxID=2864206 RepID=UPI001C65C09B|nr:hypothetical protein [Shewanella psychrotolerans]QYK03123.1 hypothetical protein K0I62_09485 [Shewanella psychrotolerans]
MKITTSEKIELLKITGIGIAVIIAWKYIRTWSTPIGQWIDSGSAAAGVALSDITAALNGNHRVEFSEARFFLDERYIENDLTVNRTWIQTLIKSNAEIEPLFNELLDVKGRLKLKYEHLINGEVSAETLANASGVTIGLVNQKV